MGMILATMTLSPNQGRTPDSLLQRLPPCKGRPKNTALSGPALIMGPSVPAFWGGSCSVYEGPSVKTLYSHDE